MSQTPSLTYSSSDLDFYSPPRFDNAAESPSYEHYSEDWLPQSASFEGYDVSYSIQLQSNEPGGPTAERFDDEHNPLHNVHFSPKEAELYQFMESSSVEGPTTKGSGQLDPDIMRRLAPSAFEGYGEQGMSSSELHALIHEMDMYNVCGKLRIHAADNDRARRRNDKASQIFSCSDCEVACKREKDLQRHVMSVHKKGPVLSCVDCSFTHRRKDKVTAHHRKMHPPGQ